MVYYYCNHNDLNINTIRVVIPAHMYLVILFQRLHATLRTLHHQPPSEAAGCSYSLCSAERKLKAEKHRAGRPKAAGGQLDTAGCFYPRIPTNAHVRLQGCSLTHFSQQQRTLDIYKERKLAESSPERSGTEQPRATRGPRQDSGRRAEGAQHCLASARI